ncbi:NifU family protein [Labrys sp. 22185]|uniref:NifU family protein n=1 Tax=Labrys sp. 22185 TaxID=3453888 RepID=UPI003F85B9A1
MFIQTEATPNPSTLKFLPGREVLPEGTTLHMTNAAEGAQSPLAQKLFSIEGVAGVFFGSDFITITRSGVEWQHLKPAVLGAIMEHYLSGVPILNKDVAPLEEGAEFFDEADEDTVETIKDLLETRVRPAVAADGGDITFRGYREGVVYLAMKGACSGCPSSTATLRNGIQNLLRHFVPEVQEVRAA